MTGPKKKKVVIECEYCGHDGEYPTVVELRDDKFACVDIAACDARWAKANPPDPEDK